MATSLIVNKTTTAMKSNQKSIPNISDTASDYDCMNFATHLIEDLSTDTVDGVYRVQRTDITDATPTPHRTQATITIDPTSVTTTQINALTTAGYITINYTYNGDGNVIAYTNGFQNDLGYFTDTLNSNNSFAICKVPGATNIQQGTITVYAPETNNYTSATATLTITA